MNCPYCNSKCLHDYMCGNDTCPRCKYSPNFIDWNKYNNTSFTIEDYTSVMFSMSQGEIACYDPSTQKLSTVLGSFKINETVIPENIERIMEKIKNLKAFI